MKTPPTAGAAFGGDDDRGRARAARSRVVILIASARDDAPGDCAVPCAPADPKASNASGDEQDEAAHLP